MALSLTAGSLDKPPDTLPWLHVAVLDHAAGAGTFGAGWLADPEGSIASISIGKPGAASPIDLLRDSDVPMTRDFLAAFGAPEAVHLRPFLVWLPKAAESDTGQAAVEIGYRDGSSEHLSVPQSGHVAEIGRLFEIIPVGEAVPLAERLLARRGADFGETIPPPVAVWMARLHRRLGALPDIRTVIEEVISVANCGMLLRFRLPFDEAPTVLTLRSLAGRRVALRRPATSAAERGSEEGAVAVVFAPIPGLRPDSEQFWFVEAAFADAHTERVPLKCPAPPPQARGIEAVLALTTLAPGDLEALLERAVAPAVAGFWTSLCRSRRVEAEAAYGPVTGSPRVSVIVALGEEIEQMRHQVAQFSNDAEFCADSLIELIYVVDDPSVNETLLKLAQCLYEVYGVPFRTILGDCCASPPGGANLGAAAAAGRVLLFLGAEVLPKRAGWVGKLLRSYEAAVECGILGCRLLAEDGSIRHGGVTFRKATTAPGGWEEHYRGAGWPGHFDRSDQCSPVPAVTGACLMIEATVFGRLAGFSDDYIYGGFADFDLCCACWQGGRRVYYTPQVELYQLAHRQTASRRPIEEQLDLYNRWQFGRKWTKFLPDLPGRCAA